MPLANGREGEQLTRKAKIKLIESRNPEWKDLSDE